MKLITRNTDYAIRALCYVAQEKKSSVSASEMVAKLRIPRPFLRKLLQKLSAEGILKSTKGKGGGFALKKKPSLIRLTELIQIFQGSVEMNECIFKKRICSERRRCQLKCEIDRIERDVLDRLHGITIASLLKNGNGMFHQRKG